MAAAPNESHHAQDCFSRNFSRIAWAIIIAGALFRIAGFLANRSLWCDEAGLAANIINRSFIDLTKPLEQQQNAPIGFLFLERAVVLVFGTGEYALRLVPLLSALAALYLFYLVARKC